MNQQQEITQEEVQQMLTQIKEANKVKEIRTLFKDLEQILITKEEQHQKQLQRLQESHQVEVNRLQQEINRLAHL